MKSNYDEIIRDSFSQKIEVPKEYQQKMKETLRQAGIAASQKKQSPIDKRFQANSIIENFFQRHKISVKACLSLTGGICACLGLAVILSVFLRQDNLRKDFNHTQKQYVEISATPVATEDTVTADNLPKTENSVTADNSLRTEIPADTESPRRTKLPWDTTNPTLNVNSTHSPEKEQKNGIDAAPTEKASKPDNNTTNNHKQDTTATPKRTETTRSPELAQVQTSYTPEIIETPQKTTTPASIETPKKTKTPENSNTPQVTDVPAASKTPDSEIIVFPTAVETPAGTPVQASTMPST